MQNVLRHNQIKKIRWWDIVKVLISLSLLGYAISKTNFDQLLLLREQFSWKWFLFSVILFSAMVLVKAMQYYYLIGKKIPYSKVLEVVVLQKALMNFVATAAGIASTLTILGMEKKVKIDRAASSFLIIKIGDLFAVIVLFLCSSFFIDSVPDIAIRIVALVSIFAILIFVFFFSLIIYRKRFVDFIRMITFRLNIEDKNIIQKGLKYLNSLVAYDQRKIFRLVWKAIFLSLIYMLITMAWGYVRLRMFSLVINVEVVIFVYALLQIASWVPIFVLGGLGITETLSLYLFGLFGVNPVDLVAVLLGVRLIVYLLNASFLLYLPIETIVNSRHKGVYDQPKDR